MSTDENKLIEDNMDIAYHVAWKYYNKFQHKIDIQELQSICLLGLVKAGKTYNPNLNFNFSTYSYRCMLNEILYYFKVNKKHFNTTSIFLEIGDEIQLGDTLADDLVLDEYLEKTINLQKLNQYINKLESNLQQIVRLKLNGLTMEQIGRKFNLTASQVSREYQKAINILRNYLL